MKSKKSRYEIQEDYASDHFMIKDTNFNLIDLETGHGIAMFVGTWEGGSETGAKNVTITRDNKTVVVTNHDGSEYRYSIEELKNPAEARARLATRKRKGNPA